MCGDADSQSLVPICTDAHAAEYVRILAHSFGKPESEAASWVQRFGRENCRVLLDGGKVVAGLNGIPMGQFFGGRSVGKVGVSAVGTAPEARGKRVATELMRRYVLELHDMGAAISGLYPATQKLYRGVGYEQSGHRFEVRVPLGAIGVKSDELVVRPLEEADTPRVRALHAREARRVDGNLDRSLLSWDRIERPPPTRTELARAFVVERDLASRDGGIGGLEGYVYLTQSMPAVPIRGKFDVHVHDMVAATPRAARRLWAFLSSYSTMGHEMVWFAGPTHPMLAMLPEQPYRMTNHMNWMTRIIDVCKALEARGYPAGVRAAMCFNITDPLIAGNNSAFIVEVSEGRAAVTRGESGSRALPLVTATINGLATMYTGFLSPWALRSMGLVDGDDEGMNAAASMFGGSMPWMSDMY